MKKIELKLLAIIAASALLIAIFQNCSHGGGGGGGSGSGQAPSSVGTFIDDPVAGLSYKTSSGITGVTNSLGQFTFNPGDTVTFYAMGVTLGTTSPTVATDGTASVTPMSLVPGATAVTDPQVTTIAQFLGTLNTIAVANGSSATGVFTIPTNTNLQTQLSSTSPSATTLTEVQLQAALDSVFGTGTYTVTTAATAQNTLQTGINSASISGTVWSGVCTCGGGATLYFQPNGVLSGITNDGSTIAGTWTIATNGDVNFSGATPANGYGNAGIIAAGATAGTLQIYQADNTYQGVLNLTKVTSSSAVTNSSWVGTWIITATPTTPSSDNNGGCANMIIGPNSYTAVTNDGKSFSGAIAAAGAATGTFSNNDGTTTSLNFDMSTLSGSYSNAKGGGSVSIGKTGTCAKTNNNNNGGTGPNPTPTPGSSPTPNPSPSPTPGSSPIVDPTPTVFNNSTNILVPITISWANTPTSANSIAVTLQALDGNGNPIAFTNQSDSSGQEDNSGTRFTTTNDIAVSFTLGTAQSYKILAGSCTVSGGVGTIGSQGTTYSTANITCN